MEEQFKNELLALLAKYNVTLEVEFIDYDTAEIIAVFENKEEIHFGDKIINRNQ